MPVEIVIRLCCGGRPLSPVEAMMGGGVITNTTMALPTPCRPDPPPPQYAMTEHPSSSLEEDEVVVEEGTPCHVNPNTGNERGSVRDGGDTSLPMLFWTREFR